MPPSAEAKERLGEIVAEVTQLEQLCNEMELALRETDFARLDAAIADARRTTHALENAMHAAADVRDERFDATLFARLQKIFDVREEQQRRLEMHRDSIGERLNAIARWREYARSIAGSKAARRRVSHFEDRR